jgi:hypothetical protein
MKTKPVTYNYDWVSCGTNTFFKSYNNCPAILVEVLSQVESFIISKIRFNVFYRALK